jgi:hypothetical protein
MSKKALWWAVLIVGVAMIVMPFAMGLPGKAAAGNRMLNDFRPIMQPRQVQLTSNYYYKVFVPLGQITPMFSNQNAAKFQGYLTGMQKANIQIPPAAAKDFTGLVTMMKNAVPVAQQVPAGLQHYKPLVDTMQGNVSNFHQMDQLPKFTLFTWFFVIPGILLALLAGAGLWSVDGLHVHIHRPHPAG